ncbi:MAG: hypothetical protein RLZZ510_1360, partial [Bacteroidota bacterium]
MSGVFVFRTQELKKVLPSRISMHMDYCC